MRLTRSEVDGLAKDGYLEECTIFGTGALVYALEARADIVALQAAFENNKITLYVPADIATSWAKNEQVGYDNTVDTGNGQLYLLLEKDFKCIDAPPAEDQSDNFENPHKVC